MARMPYRPRRERDAERISCVAAAARARGASAIDIALAQIGTGFDDTAAINGFKIRVEELLRLPPGDPVLRARFGARAALLSGRSLNEATAAVEQWWRAERKAFQIVSALNRGNALSLDVLRELRLILRIVRRKKMERELYAIAAALGGRTHAVAAE
jgi:hypothetical protein